MLAILSPCTSLPRTLDAIWRRATLGESAIHKAVRAGAALHVVRAPYWRPRNGDAVNYVVFGSMHRCLASCLHNWRVVAPTWIHEVSKYWKPADTSSLYVEGDMRIFGRYVLPPGYALAYLPSDANIDTEDDPTKFPIAGPDATIIYDYNVFKILGAAGQLGASFLTMYHSKGDQVHNYSYLAPGLTVVPYAVLAILSVIANLCTPEFSRLYLVHSEIMDEAISRGGSFACVLGRLCNETQGNPIPGVGLMAFGGFEVDGFDTHFRVPEGTGFAHGLGSTLFSSYSTPIPHRCGRGCSFVHGCPDNNAVIKGPAVADDEILVPSCPLFQRKRRHPRYHLKMNPLKPHFDQWDAKFPGATVYHPPGYLLATHVHIVSVLLASVGPVILITALVSGFRKGSLELPHPYLRLAMRFTGPLFGTVIGWAQSTSGAGWLPDGLGALVCFVTDLFMVLALLPEHGICIWLGS